MSDQKENDGCPPGTIKNPKTGRCVKINGVVGKELLAERAGIVLPPKPCSRQIKEECLRSPKCKWVVGKGCRSRNYPQPIRQDEYKSSRGRKTPRLSQEEQGGISINYPQSVIPKPKIKSKFEAIFDDEQPIRQDEYKSSRGRKTPKLSTIQEEKGTNGFIISNTLVERISGPVNVHILKPTMDFHLRTGAPIFVLFGDRHFSETNMCENCVCDSHTCCYPIFSPDFLKLIDQMASEEYPIDFNVETPLTIYNVTFPNAQEQKFLVKDVDVSRPPIDKLAYIIKPCNRINKGTEFYATHCPTKNIRWQLIDPRHVHNHNYKYTTSTFIDALRVLLKSLKKNNVNMVNTIKSILNRFPILKNQTYLNSLFTITDEKYYDSIDRQTSVVFKQISKMSEADQRQWDIWCREYYKYVYATSITDTQDALVFLTRLVNCIVDYYSRGDEETLIEFVKYSNKHPNKRSKLTKILLVVNTINVDLYLLTRAFKKPVGSNRPLLSFGYFGNFHTKNIIHFLTNIMGQYEFVYAQPETQKGNRCLEINQRVDLQELMDSYKR